MSETVDRTRSGAFEEEPAGRFDEEPAAMERRIFRSMCVAVVVTVLASACFARWRVTTGLCLGGALSLFNHYWLRTAVVAAFETTTEGARPKFNAARYVLRYVISTLLVVIAYWLDVVSLAATLVGMCSFVAGALWEGLRQLYFAIMRREEN